mmetsp:Transcript_56346/g.91182  ORF Transcript_56346/g.91182 Transcript_56346/m.91182 type:complete len:1208 (+) Transcript_56346:127-3750(+)
MSVAEDERSVAGDGGEEGDDLYMEIQVESLNDLEIGRHLVQGVQDSWRAFLDNSESDQAAGEAIYSALFEGAPSLQPLFITPRAVQSVRFLNGIKNFVHVINNPTQLKVAVETLGFGHLNIEVTIPRVMIFRDALIDLLEGDLGDDFGPAAREGWMTLLSYIGGALIYVRTNYAERLRILADSWKAANRKDVPVKVVEERKKKKEKKAVKEENGTANGIEQNGADPLAGLDLDGLSNSDASSQSGSEGNFILNEAQKQTRPSMMSRLKTSVFGQNGSAQASGGDNKDSGKKHDTNSKFKMHMGGADVPRTFEEMFQWNCAVMGLAGRTWMKEVLVVFDAIVTNVSDSTRLQQECSVLAIKIGKCGWTGPVNLTEYKSCMLAALRSLLPKVWDSNYEVAWNWLWDNVEILLKKNMGQPLIWEKSLQKCLTETLDVATQYEFRKDCYERFFTAAPGGQDYFKQSNTRLHFIAERITWMTLELLQEPWKMVDDISALGLRHVGFGIPTDLFGPLATAYIEVFGRYVADDLAVEAYRWSIGLISQMLVQTITEGSTIVMKAINTNSEKQLQRAVACAPRGKRAMWMLNIAVGTQSISPFYWSIESGSMEAAKAMILDLLTIRADRDNYYYGSDSLFERHPDVVQRLCADAQALLPILLDGLIWRSRLTQGGQRRVNFYIKHLVQDADGKFNQALEWLVEAGDPKILCHPVVVLFSDLVWTRLVNMFFLLGKAWFLFTLTLFIVSQSILQHLNEGHQQQETRNAIFGFRCFIYLFSMGQLLRVQLRFAISDIKAGRWVRVAGIIQVPDYLTSWKNSVSLILMILLMIMLSQEPILWCLSHYDAAEETSEEILAHREEDLAHAASAAAGGSASGAASAAASHLAPAVAAGHRLLSAAASAVLGASAAAAAVSGASVAVSNNGDLFTQHCPEGDENIKVYAPISMLAMLLYWTLIVDLTVFSTRISAFVLVCGRVISELGLFIMASLFLIVAFASAISALNHHNPDFKGIPKGMMSLAEIALSMYPTEKYAEMQETTIVLVCVSLYNILVVIFLLNLLIAQLNGAYQSVYADMVGYARLNRGSIIGETMQVISSRRWSRWLAGVKLDERLEFNEGDVGLAGGVQVLEPANANPTNVDMIHRFGGSTSPAMQWPKEDGADNESDKFERLEKVILRATKKMSGKKGGKSGAGGSSSMGLSNSQLSSSGAGSEEDSQ